jgi:hypothetical protein
VRLWDAKTLRCLRVLEAGGKVTSLVWDSMTVVACVNGGRSAVAWDSKLWSVRSCWDAHERGDWGSLVLLKGAILLVGSNRSTDLLAFDAHTGVPIDAQNLEVQPPSQRISRFPTILSHYYSPAKCVMFDALSCSFPS